MLTTLFKSAPRWARKLPTKSTKHRKQLTSHYRRNSAPLPNTRRYFKSTMPTLSDKWNPLVQSLFMSYLGKWTPVVQSVFTSYLGKWLPFVQSYLGNTTGGGGGGGHSSFGNEEGNESFSNLNTVPNKDGNTTGGGGGGGHSSFGNEEGDESFFNNLNTVPNKDGNTTGGGGDDHDKRGDGEGNRCFFNNLDVNDDDEEEPKGRCYAVEVTKRYARGTMGHLIHEAVKPYAAKYGDLFSGRIGEHYEQSDEFLRLPATPDNIKKFAERETKWWRQQPGRAGVVGSLMCAETRACMLMNEAKKLGLPGF